MVLDNDKWINLQSQHFFAFFFSCLVAHVVLILAFFFSLHILWIKLIFVIFLFKFKKKAYREWDMGKTAKRIWFF